MDKSKLSAIAVAVFVATGLAACSSGFETKILPSPDPTTPALTDAFFSFVSGIVSSSAEDSEPKDIASVVATAPEDKEPEPLS
ncbi:MAG: hypothetical protein M3R60_14390 [Pseudomonadota bacterium]|nr:hypothetical protein [Pseudomonadota bacterium]